MVVDRCAALWPLAASDMHRVCGVTSESSEMWVYSQVERGRPRGRLQLSSGFLPSQCMFVIRSRVMLVGTSASTPAWRQDQTMTGCDGWDRDSCWLSSIQSALLLSFSVLFHVFGAVDKTSFSAHGKIDNFIIISCPCNIDVLLTWSHQLTRSSCFKRFIRNASSFRRT